MFTRLFLSHKTRVLVIIPSIKSLKSLYNEISSMMYVFKIATCVTINAEDSIRVQFRACQTWTNYQMQEYLLSCRAHYRQGAGW